LACSTPDGAFYAYANCSGVIGKKAPDGTVMGNDQDFVLYLLNSASVTAIPGSAYGLGPYFRISYATSLSVLQEAVAAIDKAVQALI
jgi:aspartate aminotransferase